MTTINELENEINGIKQLLSQKYTTINTVATLFDQMNESINDIMVAMNYLKEQYNLTFNNDYKQLTNEEYNNFKAQYNDLVKKLLELEDIKNRLNSDNLTFNEKIDKTIVQYQSTINTILDQVANINMLITTIGQKIAQIEEDINKIKSTIGLGG